MSAYKPHPGDLKIVADGNNHPVFIAGYVENHPTALQNAGSTDIGLNRLGVAQHALVIMWYHCVRGLSASPWSGSSQNCLNVRFAITLITFPYLCRS